MTSWPHENDIAQPQQVNTFNLPDNTETNNILIKPEIKKENNFYSKLAWTLEEDHKLTLLVKALGQKKWKMISKLMDTKTPRQCIYRWYKVLLPKFKTVRWDDTEDQFIISWVKSQGTNSWTECAKTLKRNKTPKMCKERWFRKLSTQAALEIENKIVWTPLKELELLFAVKAYGTSWSKIKKIFPQIASENELKNKFYSIMRGAASKYAKICGNASYVNVFLLNTNQLLFFLSSAMNEYKRIISKEEYLRVQESLMGIVPVKDTYDKIPICCSTGMNSTNQILSQNKVMNICENCRNKLKERIKRKLILKYISRQVNSLT